jgi:hypothetical protein
MDLARVLCPAWEGIVRKNILAASRWCLIAFVAAGLLNMPALAAAKPLGRVVSAQNAHLANALAVSGADLYPGDPLATEPSGSMRLKIGDAQVYMLGSTVATLSGTETINANVTAGTFGFSTPKPEPVEVVTPLGSVRAADGQRVFGQIAILDPNHLMISAYEGSLVFERNGETHTVGEGQSYDVNLLPNSSKNADVVGAGGTGTKWGTVVPTILIAGGLTVAGVILWNDESETCSNMTCQ